MLCLVVVLPSYKFGKESDFLRETADIMGKDVVVNALSYSGNSRINMEALISSTSAIIPFAAIALALGMIATLAKSQSAPTLLEWKDRVRALHTYLYLSAAVLASGVLFHSLRTTWMSSGLGIANAKDITRLAFADLVAANAAYKGVQFSLLVASYYLPAAFLLARERGGGGIQVWRRMLPCASALKAILALLAPFFVGALGQVINALVK